MRETKGKLQSIINKLDSYGYKQSLMLLTDQSICYDPWFNFKLIRNKILLCELENRILVLAFYLGIEVDINEILVFLSKDDIEVLENYDILSVNNNLFRAKRCLIPYNQYYIFVDFPSFFPTCINKETPIYLGVDSFFFANIMPRVTKAKVLDICAGSGLHSIILEHLNNKVTSIDISSETINVACLNCEINGVKNIELIKNNLLDNIKEKYDFIISNPPTQIIPENIGYPIIGNGGKDGLDIISKIIQKLDKRLEEDGCFFCIVQLMGDEKSPYFAKRLDEISQKNKWTTMLSIHNRMTIDDQIESMSSVIQNICGKNIDRQQWKQFYEKNNFKYLYNCIIKINKTKKYKFTFNYLRKYAEKTKIKVQLPLENYLEHLCKFNLNKSYSSDFYQLVLTTDLKEDILKKLKDSYEKLDYCEFERWLFQQEDIGIIQLYI